MHGPAEPRLPPVRLRAARAPLLPRRRSPCFYGQPWETPGSRAFVTQARSVPSRRPRQALAALPLKAPGAPLVSGCERLPSPRLFAVRSARVRELAAAGSRFQGEVRAGGPAARGSCGAAVGPAWGPAALFPEARSSAPAAVSAAPLRGERARRFARGSGPVFLLVGSGSGRLFP